MVNSVVEPDELMGAAQKLAGKIASGPTQAFGQVKALLDGSFYHSLETQMELEARAIAGFVNTPDGPEGLHAFLGKRKPEFKGI